MKIKLEFVTNSSSCSFVILKKNLSDLQISMIHDHIEIASVIAKNENKHIYAEKWNITENDTEISGYTSMDNFDMMWFLKYIGILDEHIEYDHS